MAEPIRTESPRAASHAEDLASFDPGLEPEIAGCRARPNEQPLQTRRDPGPTQDSSTELGVGAESLASQFRQTSRVALPAAALPMNTNAERVAATKAETGYLRSGTTPEGVTYHTAALIYGRDAKLGLFDETLSASVQYGAQNEVQIAGMRYGVSSDSGSSLGVEVLTAQASFGAHNKDGSRGENISVGVTLVGTEGTLTHSGNSLTVGAAIGITGELSVGVRDADADGLDELCFRVALPAYPFSGGLCVEEPE